MAGTSDTAMGAADLEGLERPREGSKLDHPITPRRPKTVTAEQQQRICALS